MRYSSTFKANILKKILPPENRPILEVCKETGIAAQTIYNWIKKTKDGTLNGENGLGANNRSFLEKFNLLLEGRGLSEDQLGQWLRENGLHSQHLSLWEQELKDTMSKSMHKDKEVIKELKKKNRDLEKELARKEKALAEMAALLTLKKKADKLWGGDEDD